MKKWLLSILCRVFEGMIRIHEKQLFICIVELLMVPKLNWTKSGNSIRNEPKYRKNQIKMSIKTKYSCHIHHTAFTAVWIRPTIYPAGVHWNVKWTRRNVIRTMWDAVPLIFAIMIKRSHWKQIVPEVFCFSISLSIVWLFTTNTLHKPRTHTHPPPTHTHTHTYSLNLNVHKTHVLRTHCEIMKEKTPKKAHK